MAIALLLGATIAACNATGDNTQKSTEKEHTTTAALPSTSKEGLKIAIVRMDSVLNNSLLYKEMNRKMETRLKSGQANINSRLQSVQADAQSFQQKLQSGGFVNETAARMEQERIMKKQQEVDQLSIQYQQQIAQQQAAYTDSLNTIIHEQIRILNKDLGYDLILSDVAEQNVLLGRADMDITDLVIKAVNDQYKGEEKPEKK